MMSSRFFSSTLLGVALLAGCADPLGTNPGTPGMHHDSPQMSELMLPHWSNTLTRPPELTVPATGLQLTMQQGLHDFGLAGNRLTPVWGYALPGESGSYMGPTLWVDQQTPVQITYQNNLPSQLPFPLSQSAEPGPSMVDPEGHAIPHLHGGHTDPESDGLPEQSFLNDGTTRTMTYRNDQAGAILWYHDHAMGLTRTNVYAGLAGMYLLRDPLEKSLNLPWADAYDMPLVLQDKAFNKDGTLAYPADWEPEFFGDAAVVNGKIFPSMNVEPRQYRFRVLNASNSRFYDLQLNADGAAVPFQQIGSDGGLLPRPVTLSRLLLAPGERADVMVDFAGRNGQSITLTNQAETPYGGGVDKQGGTPALPNLMRFKVGETVSVAERLTLPATLAPAPSISAAEVKRVRYLTLDEILDPETDSPQRMLLGTLNLHTGASEMHGYHDPVTETPTVNEAEEWVLINNTVDAHPIHVHQVPFMVIERASVERVPGTDHLEVGNPGNVQMLNGAPVFTDSRPPEANEEGWKDTVIVYPGEMARIRLKFDIPGRYVWHCHILEHEENDMMRPIQVLNPGETAPTTPPHMGH